MLVVQVMLHCLGQQQTDDQCILQEDQPECFLELATTNDGAYVTINSNAKTASEVGACTLDPAIIVQWQLHLPFSVPFFALNV